MAKTLNLLVDFLCYEGTTSNQPQDAIQLKKQITDSSIDEVFRVQDSVANNATDQSVSLASDCKYLVIATDRTISVKLNGISTAIVLAPKTEGTKAIVFMWRGTITSLTVTNTSGSVANIDVISVGA